MNDYSLLTYGPNFEEYLSQFSPMDEITTGRTMSVEDVEQYRKGAPKPSITKQHLRME